MSQRTIVEINHDACNVREHDAQTFAMLLSRAIASGSPESWRPLERFGIQRIVQCHHSDERKVVAHGRDYPIG